MSAKNSNEKKKNSKDSVGVRIDRKTSEYPVTEEQEKFKHDEDLRLLNELDLSFYRAFYPDLSEAGITSDAALIQHYVDYGHSESRLVSAGKWLTMKGLPEHLLDGVENWSDTLERIRMQHHDIMLTSVLDGLLQSNAPAYEFLNDAQSNSELYTNLSRFYLTRGLQVDAASFLTKAIRFNPKNGVALEYLGNIELENERPENAARFYSLAIEVGNEKGWSLLNLSKARLSLGQLDMAYEAVEILMRRYPDFTLVLDHLDALAAALWQQTEADTAVAVLCDQREKLVKRVGEYARKVYHGYLIHYGVEAPPAYIGDINLGRVLVIGDFCVPQCTRYRIEQKIEQLESAGVEATAVNWLEIGDHIDQLAFYDIVIFYRVPAVPKILKAMAQVTAAGKLAIYEIDDLLFEPIYPPPLHTYGTLVDEHTYVGLMKGMALYNAAARCCRVGLASTQALADRLGPLTQSGQCLLHRNGLDYQNIFRLLDRSFKKTVDIFYGSGTKAHNSDLIDIILPVMEAVLSMHPKARFVIMGYAQVPRSFMERFGEQVLYLPPTETVGEYYEALQWAEISLAVLHPDEINDCKSELKWFEAACFGIPSVLSSTANYRDVIEDGVDGFLASTTQDWVSTLNRLILDPDLRASVGQYAHDRVRSEYAPDFMGSAFMAALKKSVKMLQAPERAQAKKSKVAIVNVFMRPQSIGGATRVVEDNLDNFSEHYENAFEVVLFSSDVHARPPHRVSVHMDGHRRNYRATIQHREHMDWHPCDPEVYRLFSEFLEVEKPHVVHFHCVQRLTASVVEAARDAGVPYIITVHDAWWISDHQFMVSPSGQVFADGHPDPFAQDIFAPGISPQASLQRRNHLKSLLLGAAAVTTVSNKYAEIYACNGITGILPIRNGLSEARDWQEKDTSDCNRVVIGHIGGMSTHKGFDLLRATMEELNPPNIQILVVDHSMEENAVRWDRWGTVRVKFIGRVAQSRVVDLYRQIDVLAAPSIWPESFGLVTREAAACGCWVIASNMGGIGEDVINGRTGFVIPPDRKALAKVVAEIDANPMRFKEPAPPSVIHYANEQAKKLVSLYETLLP